jgi:hypothetical protein
VCEPGATHLSRVGSGYLACARLLLGESIAALFRGGDGYLRAPRGSSCCGSPSSPVPLSIPDELRLRIQYSAALQ